ncbi:DNA-3-methyladenine glycosylase-like protein [Dinothrombium tinctorium]|uniref:DNA-3-methyladenine glycosylase n=1 Tax=Dinothrombium tinctorium TaxID=1965070 RepID=A0A443R7V4_9ACAR|nr:DNA-3-methyladenine glycosylase-like protein [Dinothrombium tinctorium]
MKATKRSKTESEHCEDEQKIMKPVVSRFFVDRLNDDFFANVSCVNLAKKILGKLLCRRLESSGEVLKGIVVESESYLGAEDVASHSYKGKITARNEPMFMKAGTAYVYFTYGMYHCFNISSEGEGSAVLIRALQPIQGLQTMESLRKRFSKKANGKPIKATHLCNGPAKLCIAFDICKQTINKQDVTCSDLIWFENGFDVSECDIVAAPRIGISADEEWKLKPLRFYIKNNEYVSVRNKKEKIETNVNLS